MRLETLGRFRLVGSDYNRPKLWLLLTYLAIEGPRDRRFIAELFWAGAADPLTSLRVAVASLRRHLPGVLATDAHELMADVECDAAELLARLAAGDDVAAISAYAGEFLHNVRTPPGSTELEEWVFGIREGLADRIVDAHLRLGHTAAMEGDLDATLAHAKAAWYLPGRSQLAAEDLARLHLLLKLGASPLASVVKREAGSFGLDLSARTLPETGHLSGCSTLIGRDAELLDIAGLLEAGVRLITVTGPVGTGKSSLALQAARNAVAGGQFADGLLAINLRDVQGLQELGAALVTALGMNLPAGTEPWLAGQAVFAERQGIVIIDDFIPGQEQLVQALLRRCPGLVLIVTTAAAPPALPGEVLRLEGLRVPRSVPAADEVDFLPAMLLFWWHAKHVQPEFRLDEMTLPHVHEVCTYLKGYPAALEAAASRLSLVPLDQLAAYLRNAQRAAGADSAQGPQLSCSDAEPDPQNCDSRRRRSSLLRGHSLQGNEPVR